MKVYDYESACTSNEMELRFGENGRPKTKLKGTYAHSRVSRTKLNAHLTKITEVLTKMSGTTYTQSAE